MAVGKRAFRSPESIEAERFTRACVQPYLSSRGFTVLADERRGPEQLVSAITPSGEKLRMRVRTCWKWAFVPSAERRVSACQLTAGNNGGWEATFGRIAAAQDKAGTSHILFVQGDEVGIQLAALVPSPLLYPIWQRQRDVCSAQISSGRMGRIKANFVENGDSPTIWLKDERAPGGKDVADVFWTWPGVQDLGKLTQVEAASEDDTFDDLTGVDYSMYGADGAPRVKTTRSEVKRDDRVRRKVLERASGCERESCGERRVYAGFLDVHHVLGVERSDRVWNCVALCPNCHREAHFSPERDKLNAELIEYARRFAPATLKPA
jgi:5-methylcytosine-specific restriction enzyme A